MKERKPRKPKPSKFAIWWRWPLIVLALSFSLSLGFGLLSQFALSNAGVIVSVIVIFVFLIISILSDMVGVAITAANIEPFRAMAARKVRGAKEAIKLIQNKEKVASISADVIGDICGILSGAAGTSITVVLVVNYLGSFLEVLIASLVSAVIAALVIFGKALFKKYSMIHAERIILILAKFISLFHRQGKREKSDKSRKYSKKSEKEGKKRKKYDIKYENNKNISINNKICIDILKMNKELLYLNLSFKVGVLSLKKDKKDAQ